MAENEAPELVRAAYEHPLAIRITHWVNAVSLFVMVASGLRISGSTPDGTYVEMVEIPGHPYFIGCQFHPEFKSKPLEPHPLFKAFIGAAYEHGQKKKLQKGTAEVEMFLRPEKVGRR